MRNLSPSFKTKLASALTTIRNNHPKLNYGGCGVFAKIVANQLIKRGFNVEFVLLFRTASSVQQANEHALNNNTRMIFNTAWVHVLLKVNGNYIDSTGIYKSKLEFYKTCNEFNRFIIGDALPTNIANEFLSSKHKRRWNYVFDRRQSGVIAMQFANNLK